MPSMLPGTWSGKSCRLPCTKYMLFFHHYLYCGLIFKAKLGKHSMLQNEEVIDQKVGLSSGGWLGRGGGAAFLYGIPVITRRFLSSKNLGLQVKVTFACSFRRVAQIKAKLRKTKESPTPSESYLAGAPSSPLPGVRGPPALARGIG